MWQLHQMHCEQIWPIIAVDAKIVAVLWRFSLFHEIKCLNLELEKAIFPVSLQILDWRLGGKNHVDYDNFEIATNFVYHKSSQFSLFLPFTGLTSYYHGMYLVLAWFTSCKGFADIILHVGFRFLFTKIKFCGKPDKFGGIPDIWKKVLPRGTRGTYFFPTLPEFRQDYCWFLVY